MVAKTSKKIVSVTLFLLFNRFGTLWGQDDGGLIFQIDPENSQEIANTEDLLQFPLDINRVTPLQLQMAGLFTPEEQSAFLDYRNTFGPFVSLYELQAIPGFAHASISNAIPYLICTMPGQFSSGKLKSNFQGARTRLSFSGRTIISGPSQALTLGSPLQWQVRIRHQKPGSFSMGFQVEKDAGEAGIDFLAAYLQIKHPYPWIKQLILGDFKVNWAQGLIASQGFYALGGQINPNRAGNTFQVHGGVDEFNFFRGMALEFGNPSLIKSSLFFSLRKLGGNPESEDGEIIIRTLKKDGIHDTSTELTKKRQMPTFTTGLRLEHQGTSQTIGIQGVFNHYTLPLSPSPNYYNGFYFRGQNLTNLSMDHDFQFHGMNVFGEYALGSPFRGLAIVQGIGMSPSKELQLSLLYRNYGLRFQSIFGNPYSRTSQTGNEKGILLQLNWKVIPSLTISASTDMWQHLAPIYLVRGPSRGFHTQFRLEYSKRKHYTAYLLFEIREKPAPDETRLNQIPVEGRQKEVKARLHFQYKMNNSLEYRIRLNMGILNRNQASELLRGMSLQQDLLFSPSGKKLHFNARIAIIKTDDYDLRFYNYENGLLNQFNMVPYYNKGLKTYLNLRYRGIRNTVIEAGINHLERPGNNVTDVSKTQISFQLQYNFH